MHRSALPGKQKSKPFKGVPNATNHETQSLFSRSSRCNTRRIDRSPKGGTTAAGVPRPAPSGRLGRPVRRRPPRKRTQPRPRLPASQPLQHVSGRSPLRHHRSRPQCHHDSFARRVLRFSRNQKKRRREMSTKEAAKPLQECVKETETIELYFQQGSSDKVYHLQLESIEEQWSVNAQWGRCGSALQNDAKVSSVAYAEAKRVYDRIIREKTGKGYRIAEATTNGNTPISVGLPSVKEHSGHTPELLTPIEEQDALRLVQDASWWFQQKFDGRRLAVQKAEGKYSGINKLGQIVPIDSRLAESLNLVQAQGFLADGEITDSRFYIWDLLSVNDMDLRIQPYEILYAYLTRLFRGVHDVLRVCETAMTPKAKRA